MAWQTNHFKQTKDHLPLFSVVPRSGNIRPGSWQKRLLRRLRTEVVPSKRTSHLNVASCNDNHTLSTVVYILVKKMFVRALITTGMKTARKCSFFAVVLVHLSAILLSLSLRLRFVALSRKL